jgi:hypothetical protein
VHHARARPVGGVGQVRADREVGPSVAVDVAEAGDRLAEEVARLLGGVVGGPRRAAGDGVALVAQLFEVDVAGRRSAVDDVGAAVGLGARLLVGARGAVTSTPAGGRR